MVNKFTRVYIICVCVNIAQFLIMEHSQPPTAPRATEDGDAPLSCGKFAWSQFKRISEIKMSPFYTSKCDWCSPIARAP